MTMKVYASMEAGHVPVLAGQVQPMNSGTLTITLGPDMYLGSGVPNLFRDLAHLYLSGGNRAFGAPSETAILEYDRQSGQATRAGGGLPLFVPSAQLSRAREGVVDVLSASDPRNHNGRVALLFTPGFSPKVPEGLRPGRPLGTDFKWSTKRNGPDSRPPPPIFQTQCLVSAAGTPPFTIFHRSPLSPFEGCSRCYSWGHGVRAFGSPAAMPGGHS